MTYAELNKDGLKKATCFGFQCAHSGKNNRSGAIEGTRFNHSPKDGHVAPCVMENRCVPAFSPPNHSSDQACYCSVREGRSYNTRNIIP